jgi:hypothetical protein
MLQVVSSSNGRWRMAALASTAIVSGAAPIAEHIMKANNIGLVVAVELAACGAVVATISQWGHDPKHCQFMVGGAVASMFLVVATVVIGANVMAHRGDSGSARMNVAPRPSPKSTATRTLSLEQLGCSKPCNFGIRRGADQARQGGVWWYGNGTWTFTVPRWATTFQAVLTFEVPNTVGPVSATDVFAMNGFQVPVTGHAIQVVCTVEGARILTLSTTTPVRGSVSMWLKAVFSDEPAPSTARPCYAH